MLGGRAADLLGRRRVFMVGTGLFALASLGCGLAGSDTALIAARVVQGLAAAVMTPTALSTLTTTFEEGAERNKALGVWAAIGGVGDLRPRPRGGVCRGFDRLARGSRRDGAGLASGLNNTSFQIGGAVGVAILSSVAISQADGAEPLVAPTDGFQSAFAVAIAFAAFGLLTAILLLGRLSGPAPAPTAEAAIAPADNGG
jgi:MFS family permease